MGLGEHAQQHRPDFSLAHLMMMELMGLVVTPETRKSSVWAMRSWALMKLKNQ